MKNYPKKTIGELCNIIKGETGIASAIAGEYPLVVTAKERKTSATYQFDTQAVCIPLVSSSGHGKKSLNYVHYQEGKFALGTILVAVISKDHDEISAAFLHQYLLFYKDVKIVPLMRGAANVSLAVKDIAKIEIPLPPIDEQKDFIVFFNKLQKFNDELVQEFNKQEKYVSQLKQAILQEAIAGQLTAEWRTQNPIQKGNPNTDAVALLAKIKAEKQQAIADGKLKKEKPLAEIAINELPFSIPDNWVWTNFGEVILDIEAGKSPDSLSHPAQSDKWGVVKMSAISWNIFLQEENKQLKPNMPPFKDKEIKKDDFIMTRANTSELVAKSVIVGDVRDKLLLNDKTLRVKFPGFLSKKYFHNFNNGAFARNYYAGVAKGSSPSMKNVTRDNIKSLLVPLPPLAEQKAIVEKVDKLMNIIDQLEQQIKHRKQLAEALMQTVLREAFE